MDKFITEIGLITTTFDYNKGIKLYANSAICYFKRPKRRVAKPRKSMGRSLALRRSTNRHK